MAMGIFDSVKELLGGEDSTYEYVCQDCGAEFESATATVAKVDCPECRSTKVRSASMMPQQ